MIKRKITNVKATIYKPLHRKLKIEQHELRCTGNVSNYCFTIGAHRVTLVTNPMMSHERLVLTISGTCPWSRMTHIFRNGLNQF